MRLGALQGLHEEYPTETLLIGYFCSWLFVMNRLKPRTIKQKVREVIKSGKLGLPSSFKSTTLELMLKWMMKYAGDFATEKRPLHLPLMVYVLALLPLKLRMGMQFAMSLVVACFTCLRQSEYSVSDSVPPERYPVLRNAVCGLDTTSPDEDVKIFHEKD